jgi:hypothetical protein
MKKLLSIAETSELIRNGHILVCSGEEELLLQLPTGTWIGGTIPYFLTEEKGVFDQTKIFVTDFTSVTKSATVQLYDESNLASIPQNGFANGFNFIILPALKPIHLNFALNAPDFEDLYNNPLVGLISGTALEELDSKSPKVISGSSGEISDEKAIVLHVELASDKVARLEIVNIFEEDPTSPVLSFDSTDFNFETVHVNGIAQNFSQYLVQSGRDIRFPLVTNHGGAIINSSFMANDTENNVVKFYAPLFEKTEYRFAKPINDYVSEFNAKLPKGVNSSSVTFTCNCILNYLYGELEGKSIGFSGPITFGEVAYQLLNQTFTYLIID